MNVGDLRRNSGECQRGTREYTVVGSPKFAQVRQASPNVRMKARACFRHTPEPAAEILGMGRELVVGMASHDLSNAKTTILGVTPQAMSGLMGTNMRDFHLPLQSCNLVFQVLCGSHMPELASAQTTK